MHLRIKLKRVKRDSKRALKHKQRRRKLRYQREDIVVRHKEVFYNTAPQVQDRRNVLILNITKAEYMSTIGQWKTS